MTAYIVISIIISLIIVVILVFFVIIGSSYSGFNDTDSPMRGKASFNEFILIWNDIKKYDSENINYDFNINIGYPKYNKYQGYISEMKIEINNKAMIFNFKEYVKFYFWLHKTLKDVKKNTLSDWKSEVSEIKGENHIGFQIIS